MKKITAIILAAVLILTSAIAFAGCSSTSKTLTIAIPNDTTNEARALLLLDQLGYIKLKDGAGIAATPKDIAENPKSIEFKEVEAAQVPNAKQDVDYAVINSNYAYGNILVVKEGREKEPKLLALKAALESQKVVDFINKKYDGSVVSVVANPTDGYDSSIDYNAIKGEKITIAASPTPHAEILAVVKDILKEKDITLDIKEYTDYVQPNNVVNSGELDARLRSAEQRCKQRRARRKLLPASPLSRGLQRRKRHKACFHSDNPRGTPRPLRRQADNR